MGDANLKKNSLVLLSKAMSELDNPVSCLEEILCLLNIQIGNMKE